jgi:copper transport protein
VLRRFVLFAATLAGTLALAAAPATAHASLVSSAPPAGGQIGSAGIVLHFDDPVVAELSSITVADQHGHTLAAAPIDHPNGDYRALHALAPPGAAAGAVTVTWSVVADDGHRTQGAYPGVLGAAATAAVPAPAAGAPVSSDPAVARALTVARDLGYLALAVLCGGLVFIGLIWPAGAAVSRARALLWGAAVLGAVVSVAAIGLQGASVDRGTLMTALRPATFGDVVTTPFGRALAARAALFLFALPLLGALRRRPLAALAPSWRVGAAVVATGLIRTPSFAGHSGEGPHAVIGSVADFVHLAGVSVWVGGLALLIGVVLPRRRPEELAAVVPRFSVAAGLAVAAMVVGGAVLSWQLVGSAHALVATHFGRLLLVKLGLVLALLVAAGRSRQWVLTRLDHAVVLEGDGATLRPFVMSVVAEAALAVAIVSVASVLVATHPVT